MHARRPRICWLQGKHRRIPCQSSGCTDGVLRRMWVLNVCTLRGFESSIFNLAFAFSTHDAIQYRSSPYGKLVSASPPNALLKNWSAPFYPPISYPSKFRRNDCVPVLNFILRKFVQRNWGVRCTFAINHFSTFSNWEFACVVYRYPWTPEREKKNLFRRSHWLVITTSVPVMVTVCVCAFVFVFVASTQQHGEWSVIYKVFYLHNGKCEAHFA